MYIKYQNTVCLPVPKLIEIGIVESCNTYNQWVKRGHLKVMRRGGNGRTALIDVNQMREDIRQKVISIFGDPSNFASIKLVNYIEWSAKAAEYFREYRYGEDTPLPEATQLEYTITANILNAIKKLLNTDFSASKVSKGEMWRNISKAVNNLNPAEYPHRLPANWQSLKARFDSFHGKANKRYPITGLKGLIHKNFGNEFTAKLTAESKEWILARWCNQVMRCANLAQLHEEYNEAAPAFGWKQVQDEKTFANYLYDPEIVAKWMGHRLGTKAVEAKYGYKHTTKMASCRDALWYSDGTKLNLYYKEKTDKGWVLRSAWIYEVMDAFSEVFLGYHISKEGEKFTHQYKAFKMAIQVAGHRPYEIRFDNQGGHKKLVASEFFSNITKLAIRTQPYNGNSKSIESAFNRFQQKHLKKFFFYTGQNVTTKTIASKTNLENIKANMHKVPTYEELEELYPKLRKEWNYDTHHLSGKSRMETYLESVNEKSPEINMWDMVNMFWVWHSQNKVQKAITYTPGGISFTLNKQRFDYLVYDENDLPDLEFIEKYTDKKLFIKYDPEIMDHIYLYEEDHSGKRFVAVAKPKIEVSRAIQDQTPADIKFIRAVEAAKKEQRINRHQFTEEVLEKFDMAAWQQNFNTNKIAGLNLGKKKMKKTSKTTAIVMEDYDKAISNLTQNDIYDEF